MLYIERPGIPCVISINLFEVVFKTVCAATTSAWQVETYKNEHPTSLSLSLNCLYCSIVKLAIMLSVPCPVK